MAVPPSVDAYFAGLADPQHSALAELRATILEAAPEATEGIAYQMPALKVGGKVLVYYAAFRDHVSLFPASGGALDAGGEEGRRYRTGKGTLQFPLREPLPVDLVRRVVAVRLAEIAGTERG